jgi:predicted DCC family thiol-disulfide oxidoreductase YuxK
VTFPALDGASFAAVVSRMRSPKRLNLDALAREQGAEPAASRLLKLARLGREPFVAIGRAWSSIWFQDSPTAPLEIVRIGIGMAVLFHFGMATPFLFDLWGDAGWMPPEFAHLYIQAPWMQSVFFYFMAPWQWIAFHAVFLLSCAAFTLGWRTSWVKWIVLLGQISYDHRNLTIVYGADSIIACLLFILCLAPIGRAVSLDRVRAVHAAKRANLAATLPPYTSPWAGACIRLMQIQMALLFFYSATDKLRVDEWWTGDAIWLATSTYEFYHPHLLHLLARHYWLVNVGTYATLLIELAFPFLIWQRRTRPYLLAAAIFLHLMFAILLRLIYFSFAMTVGHMSFVYPEWLHRLGAWWRHNMGDMEMIYDGRCGFCVRSMAWFLAFDGLAQIKIRDFRTDPSPIVSDAQLETALYAVLPDGRALPGFEAYRYVVLRVPGLWWLVPLFYTPVLSRLFGHPIYNWIAANRSRLSGS